jgi:hypothetical protein
MKMGLTGEHGLLIWLVFFLTKAAAVACLCAAFYRVLKHLPEGGQKFIAGVFSDGGSPSFSRVATGLLLIFCLWWDTYFLYRNGAMPDFTGQVLFLGTIYGVNVAGSAASKFADKRGPQ